MSVECSSDSNNSLLISDVSVSDSDPANQKLSSTVSTGPEKTMQSIYISRNYDSDLQYIGDDRLKDQTGNSKVLNIIKTLEKVNISMKKDYRMKKSNSVL